MSGVSFCTHHFTTPIYEISHAREIPKMCRILAGFLNDQQHFNYRELGPEAIECKLVFTHSYDASICEIFSRMTREDLSIVNSWNIQEFGSATKKLSHSQELAEPQGLMLLLNNDRCSLDTLENLYGQIFEKIINGWNEAKLENNGDIKFKKDINEFFLYTKESSLNQEDKLIRLIARKLSLEQDLECSKTRIVEGTENIDGKLYLWVNKAAKSYIIEKVGFNLLQ